MYLIIKSKIPLDKNTNYFKTFKGTDDEGLLPDGANIKDYFTIDARDIVKLQDIGICISGLR